MTPENRALAKRTAIILLVTLALVLTCTVAVFGWRLWLLLFASSMLALLLRGTSDAIASRTGLGPRLSLGLVIVLGTGLLGATAYLLAPRVGAQVQEFLELMPAAAKRFDNWLHNVPGGEWLGKKLTEGVGSGNRMESARQVARVTYQAVIGILVILVAGIYLAIDPDTYIRGFIRLFPVEMRTRAGDVLSELGDTLQRFMLGRLASMVFVAPATGIVAWILGVPAPAVLALIAGLFTFVPYAGPIAAAIPIALLSATSGMDTFAWMMLAYTIAQGIEGFVITPIVGERMVHMPPVLTVAAEVLLGTMFGPIGVIVSVPLAAAAMVLLRRVYVERILERESATGDDVTPPEG